VPLLPLSAASRQTPPSFHFFNALSKSKKQS
jgi:hypothetical protein